MTLPHDAHWLTITARPDDVQSWHPWSSRINGKWLGVRVTTQAEADERIPQLLRVPAAVRFVWVTPTKAISLLAWTDPTGACCGNEAEFTCPGCPVRCNFVHDRDDIGTPSVGLDLVIVSGETGPHARPMHPQWVRSLRDQATGAGVPFWFEGWGEWVGGSDFLSMDDEDDFVGICADLENNTVVREVATPEAEWHNWSRIARDNANAEWCGLNDDVSVRVGPQAAGRLLDGCEWQQLPGVGS